MTLCAKEKKAPTSARKGTFAWGKKPLENEGGKKLIHEAKLSHKKHWERRE